MRFVALPAVDTAEQTTTDHTLEPIDCKTNSQALSPLTKESLRRIAMEISESSLVDQPNNAKCSENQKNSVNVGGDQLTVTHRSQPPALLCRESIVELGYECNDLHVYGQRVVSVRL